MVQRVSNGAWRIVKKKIKCRKNENAYHAPRTSRVSPLREDEKRTVQRKSVARGSCLM